MVVGNNELFYIGASPNFETKNKYEVIVNVDDTSVGNTPDAITNFTLSIADVNENTPPDVTDLLRDSLTRFQNGDRPGIYIWAAESESQNIRDNFPNFVEEGGAFSVSLEPNDNLIGFNRFQNESGAYLYAGEAESQSIRKNYPDFKEEGIAFYALDGNASQGVDIYRMQNTEQLGNYIFVREEEKNHILSNFPQYALEGVAFEVMT